MQLYSRNVWKSNHLPRDAFQPKSTAGSLEFPSIVTTSPKTDWYSPGAQQHMTPSADVVLLWRPFDIGDFRQVRKAWLAGIFNVHCRIIKVMLRTSSTTSRGTLFPILVFWLGRGRCTSSQVLMTHTISPQCQKDNAACWRSSI